ncbi:MAG TPA: metallophosphoesterase family protein [Planctomycetota bacterium]|jgi:predicted phosphodiesterase|nr:metallophosphoesterase family protein [Planctomycetota bacterium]
MPSAAFISDVHGNLEALTAVLADIDRHGYEEIFCLGDVVGYGPDPVASTNLVRERCKVTILGNHDEALVKGAWGFNQVARAAMDWTQRQLRPSIFRPGSRERWRFLAELPLKHEWHTFLLVHGSPREPTSEYILPRDAEWSPPGMFQELFDAFSSVCLVGHTHMAGLFEPGPRFVPQKELTETFRKPEGKVIINVGSVGQPRDQDWRACYLSVEDDLFRFHRVEYDVETTQKKIRAVPELDNRLADRLAEGI